jgi:Flp pilus assembly protein TadD
MSKLLTRFAPAAILLLLTACASGPATDEATAPVPNKDVDPAILSEYQYALSLMKNGDTKQASEKFSQMAKKYPDLAGSFVNQGIIYLQKEQYDEAKKVLVQATTVSPGNAMAHNLLGVAHRGLGEFDAAKQSYLEALKYNAQYANAHLNIGILYDLYLNDLQSALKHYQTYMSLTGGKDSSVEKWIVDLERRMSKS